MQSPVPVTAKDTLRAIRVFFYTMIGGMVMFSLIVFALNLSHEPQLTDKVEVNVYLVVVVGMAVVCMMAAHRIYNKRIGELQNSGMKLVSKLEAYRAILVVYTALCEGAGIFAVIVYYLTAHKGMLVVIGVVLLNMILKRPEKFKIFNELQLSAEEQAELN